MVATLCAPRSQDVFMKAIRLAGLFSLLTGATIVAPSVDEYQQPWIAIYLAWVSLVAGLEAYAI